MPNDIPVHPQSPENQQTNHARTTNNHDIGWSGEIDDKTIGKKKRDKRTHDGQKNIHQENRVSIHILLILVQTITYRVKRVFHLFFGIL